VTAKVLPALLLLAVCTTASAAQSRHDKPSVADSNPYYRTDDRRGIGLDEAASMVQARFHARVVRAETQDSGGRLTYRFKLLSDNGRVFTVLVDAETGRIL
jgi:uncharacterized membrane protein YkoI